MELTSKTYETRGEKRRDFIIGFIGWFVLNAAMLGCQISLLAAFSAADADPAFMDTIGAVFACLPLLVNIGALIFLGFTRKWIALGGLAAFGASLLLVLCLAVLFLAYCFLASSSWY